MSAPRAVLSLVVICAVIVLLSVLGLVWAVGAGLLYPQIQLDGLLLIMVCLMMGGIFSLMLLRMAREYGWLPRWRSAVEAPAANPGNAAAEQKK
jgi:hypothetical protein